ncbi:MAG: response regulator [Anaerolineaceae bacterium]|nr:response regulator [Anaerolineaceae bacterium]
MKNILVIEDEENVRENILELLNAEGYYAYGANDGEEGINLIRDQHPDLIICDILMPKLDGYKVLAIISKEPATARIPFIFLTAKTERDNLRKGMDLGADDYITKPFTRKELLQAIRTRFEKQLVLEKLAQEKLSSLQMNVSLILPHELLAPLSVILGYSEIMVDREQVINPQQMRQIAHDINQSAERLLRLIQNYLLFNELGLTFSDTNKKNAIRSSKVVSSWVTISEISNVIARNENREQDLKLDLVDAPLRISEAYLQNILQEILENAFKYSLPGSPIEISGSLLSQKPSYLLRIVDYGQGLGKEQIKNILRNSDTGLSMDELQDLGIGLILVKRLVEIHDGEFGLTSVPEKSTVVEVTLPLA